MNLMSTAIGKAAGGAPKALQIPKWLIVVPSVVPSVVPAPQKRKQARRYTTSDLREVVEPDSRLELLAYALRVRRSTN